jgi:type I restriction enzyme S subunit
MTKNWPLKTLGKVCEVIAGQSPEGKFYNSDGNGMPFYQGKKDFSEKFIGSPTTWTTQITKVALKDDVLMSVRAPVGPINFATQKICIGRGLAAIRSGEELNTNFLFYFLLSIQDKISGTEGAVFASINKNDIMSLEISVPPLTEQQRIVSILDESFEGIAKAKANAEKNLQNARAIFQSRLNNIFTQYGRGWVEKKLSQVCEKITDGTHQTPTYFDDGVVFLSSKNVTSGKIDWDNIRYIDSKQHVEMQKRVSPKLNDVLLAKNGTTGVAAIVDKNIEFDIYVSLALLRPTELILPMFLLHFINSPVAKMQFNKRLKGIGVPNLHLVEIREVGISYPESLIEQRQIVDEIDSLLAETQRLESIYQRKITALDELKQSLLHQAFTGNL